MATTATSILRGELEVFDSRDGQEQILATAGARGFIGDVAMLMGTAALASARGKADESEILEVPADRLRQALAELPGVSEPIVRAFIMRRQRLKRDREFAGLRILAQDGSRDGHQLDDFLDKNHVPHRLIDFQSEYGRALCERLHLASRDLPALITAEEAAADIIKGLRAGKFEIHFPRRFTNTLKLLQILPYRWYFALIHKSTGL